MIIFNVTLIIGILAFWSLGWSLIQNEAISTMAVEVDPLNVRPLGNAYDEPCDYLRPGRKLNDREAVRLAECFIEANGYTEARAIADRSKLTPENVYSGTDDEGLKMRHNSLEKNAYGYWRSERYGEGWEIAFRYIPKTEMLKFYSERFKTIGRCVSMDAFGDRMRVEHSNCFLTFPDLHVIEY